ncbi:RcnB family protein [Povalibacter sp.]|uniref:RcnB family protein n=1 Tax=Povalibacter sp. TaxID=1962978 RepID=UPI002F3F0906
MMRKLTVTAAMSMFIAFAMTANAGERDARRHDGSSRQEQRHQPRHDQRQANRRDHDRERRSADTRRDQRQWDRRDARHDGWRDNDRRRDGNDGRRHDRRHYDDHHPVYREAPRYSRHDTRRDYPRVVRHDHRFHAGTYYRPHGYHSHRWHPGARLPVAYYAPRYVVYDYPAYRLRPPPYGYHWVRVDNDVVLAAIATGIVLQVVNEVFW